ncbi:MAG: polysaccharide deacetylase family protein [Gammaproteobacteria bacterium]|nr:polysaccharide deacetylase family protein [Gammaproteobacteria bacterium]
MRRFVACFFLLCYIAPAPAAVVLQYHHVSDSTPVSTSIKVEQFRAHMNYLANNNYQVLALSEIIKQLQQGKDPGPKVVAITFDDGYDDVLINAEPILKQHGFSYTLFIAPDEINHDYPNMLSWAQIEQLAAGGVAIANHSSKHLHLNRRLVDESLSQWQLRITQDIEQAEQLISLKTQQNLKLLAYPYGEYNSDLQALVAKLGYVGIGQHSGALATYSDFSALPRFPASGRYANLETLAIKLKSLAMPVTSLVNANPQLSQHRKIKHKNRPVLTVTINRKDVDTRQLYCYILGERVDPIWLNKRRFTIGAPQDLPAGRSRYNCTAPSKSQLGYYWFSQPWINHKPDGSWYHG